jgi:hypothetical protein
MPITTPQFTLEDDLWWVTTALLPSWKGLRSWQGVYAGQDRAALSDGLVRIVFAPEGRDTEPLTSSEISSVAWLIENEAAIATALLSSLLNEYPSLRERYHYSAKKRAEWMPDIKSAEDLHALIGLHTVNVHPLRKDGISYAGFEFCCTWDQEHGLGVLMHGTRTVEIGGADTAILLWIAKRDAAKPR